MPNLPKPTVSAPRPTWSLTHSWRHYGRTDIHGFREVEVRALFSSNEPDAGDGLPNEIVVVSRAGEFRTKKEIHLNRAAAEQLAAMLTAALGWDGTP